jgi:hypothetical protein
VVVPADRLAGVSVCETVRAYRGVAGATEARRRRLASYLDEVAEDVIRLKVEGWNQFLERQLEQRWPPPFRHWFPEEGAYSLDWHWKFFQYVFPLDDPRDFPRLPRPQWSSGERSALERYISHARDLAGTTLLTARDGYQVSMPRMDAEPEITETKSARDAAVGYLTMLRQFYSPAEKASFKRAHDLLTRELRRQGTDLRNLATWRGAQGRLRHTHLDHLILVRAAQDGLVPQHLTERNAHHPDQLDSPEQMLSAIFYGDSIHWGERREVVAAWARSAPVIAVKQRFDALRAAVQLGHLYIGFAAVAAVASGVAERDEV